MIKLQNLTFIYNGAERPALEDINLDIQDGEFVLLTGPSSSGKSTLCRCLNGLVPHFYGGRLSGRVEVQGMDVWKHSTQELAAKVGMVFQDPESQLLTTSVEGEIAFGMENLSFPRELIARRIEEALDTTGIAHLRSQSLSELSGGEKQKVVIASVLALHPEVLLLDEPTSELDPNSAEDVLSLVQRLNDELGITVLLIEHRMDRVVHLVDRVVVMEQGRVLADGSPREVMERIDVEQAGVGIPPVVRLLKGLKARGASIDSLPLTVKESRIMLNKIIGAWRIDNSQHDGRDERHYGSPFINIDKLWFTYPTGTVALRDVDLSISEGEFVAIMGRNASGKTTLVKHLNGLLLPTKGRVEVGSADSKKSSVAKLARWVGHIFQNPNDHLFAETVEEEIAVSLKIRGVPEDKIKSAVDRVLIQFALERYRHHYPRYLSGGQKQRVALASVLVTWPKVIVLDEPTRGMEYRLKRELMECLDEYRKQGSIVILVTHDVETVAEYADRVILLSEGRIVADGVKREVLSRALLLSPQVNRLAQALGKHGVPDNILSVDEMMSLLK